MPLHHHIDGKTDSSHPPLVLLHGLFGSFENLGTVARALQSHTRVVSVDLPNHGRSAHSDTFSYKEMTQQLLQLLDELDIEQASVLGHSMGGKVAMQLAVENPQRVAKLVVADIAPVSYEPKHNTVLAALNQVDLATISNRKDADSQLARLIEEPGVRAFLLKSLVKGEQGFHWRFNLKLIAEQYGTISQGLEEQGQYPGPTLFVKGGNSDYIKAQHKADILRYFPNSKAHIVNDAGHWLHAEKPEAFNRIVQRFLFD